MEKTIGITYDITNPGKKGSAAAKTIAEEIKRIQDAVGQIDKVVVNCRQTDKKPSAMPEFDEVMALQVSLGIGEVTVNKSIPMRSRAHHARFWMICGVSTTNLATR